MPVMPRLDIFIYLFLLQEISLVSLVSSPLGHSCRSKRSEVLLNAPLKTCFQTLPGYVNDLLLFNVDIKHCLINV